MIKILRKVTTLILTCTICVTCIFSTGCTEKNKAENKEQDYYRITDTVIFDYVVDKAVVTDTAFYASYELYDKEDYTNGIYGLIKYDFVSNEKKEVVLDLDYGVLEDLYLDKNDNIALRANKIKKQDLSLVSKVTFTYDNMLELIARDESKPISESEGEALSEAEGKLPSMSGGVKDTKTDKNGNVVQLVVQFNGESDIKVENNAENTTNYVETTPLEIESLIKLSDDSFVVLGHNGGSQEIYRLDMENGKLGERLFEDEKFVNVSGIYCGKGDTVLLNEEGELYVGNLSTRKLSKVLRYIDSDINDTDISLVFEAGENTYGILRTDYQREESKLDFLKKEGKNDTVKEKQEIYLATVLADDNLKRAVIKFNETNQKYKVVIKEYMDIEADDSESEYKAAVKRFNTDMMSGDGADIIDLTTSGVRRYADKDMLENLLPYLEKDSDIRVEDFFENILNAYKTDGKLYMIPTGFEINTLAGSKSRLEKYANEVSWTLEEFTDFVEKLPQGMEVYDNVTSDKLLRTMLLYNLDEYVDWSAGNCNFSSEEFVSLLELCANYMTYEERYAGYRDEDFENEPSEITKIRNNRVALFKLSVGNIIDYQSAKMIFGDEMLVKGYPTDEGNGITITPFGLELGISSKSPNKTGAWEFISQLYTLEAQTEESMGFPVRKDALDKILEDTKNVRTGIAPDGTEYYTECTFGHDVQLYIAKPTDEEIQEMKDIIAKADMVKQYAESELYDIIEEEAEVFFNGKRSAQEVAEIIQSRASVYVKENS